MLLYFSNEKEIERTIGNRYEGGFDMLLLAKIIYYVGIVIVAILMSFLIMLIIGPTLFGLWERKHPEKKSSQSTNGTCTSYTDAISYSDDMSGYRRKQQRLQQQMQWQQENANRVAQEAMQQAQESAHTAMVTAERDHATAMDMLHVGNSMHEDAYSMASSTHDSFCDNSFSAPTFDCGGSFGGNPFF